MILHSRGYGSFEQQQNEKYHTQHFQCRSKINADRNKIRLHGNLFVKCAFIINYMLINPSRC